MQRGKCRRCEGTPSAEEVDRIPKDFAIVVAEARGKGGGGSGASNGVQLREEAEDAAVASSLAGLVGIELLKCIQSINQNGHGAVCERFEPGQRAEGGGAAVHGQVIDEAGVVRIRL